MNELKIVREVFHAQFLHVRNINNLLHSDDFEIAFNLANDNQKQKILITLVELDKDSIKNFIEEQIAESTPFEQLNIRRLREIGKYMKIKDYHVLNKMTLIDEVKRAVQRIKENSERKYLQSQQTNSPTTNIA